MKNRSVVEIIVLTFTLIIAFTLMSLSAALIFIEVRDPETNTSLLTSTLTSLISAILGALFGMMIGKNDKISQRPNDKETP